MSHADRLGVVEQLTFMISQVASMNFLFRVDLAAPFYEDRLRLTLAALQQRHPRLAVRIEPSPPRFVRDGVPPIPHRIVHASGADGWIGEAERELDGPFDTLRGPLVRVTAVLRPGGFTALLTFHHSAGDAASGALLAADFVTAWFGGELGPARCTALRPIEGRLRPRPLHQRIRATWGTLRTGLRVARSRHLKLPERAPSRPAERRQRIHPRALGPDRTSRLLERCRERGVRLTSLLAAALTIAVHREVARDGLGPQTVTCVVPVNLRPAMDPDAAGEVGMFVSFVIGSVEIDGEADPWAVAADLHRQIHGAQDRGEPLALLGLQGLALRRAGSPEALFAGARRDAEQSTGLTNLGVVDQPALVGDPRVTGVGFGAANHPTGTLFGAAVVGFRGAVQLDFSHTEPGVPAERGAAIADAVMDLLAACE